VLETPDERATLYRPLPPDVLLDNHEQAQRSLMEELRAGLAGLYQGREEDRIWSISGREALLAYARGLIGRAQRETFLVLDDADVAALEPAIVATCERGVSTSAVLTGVASLRCSQVVRHPPLESQLHELAGMMVVVVDGAEVLVAASAADRAASATVTRNRNLVLIARQFVWMELFAQRIFAHMDDELLARLDPADRRVLESAHREV
jgi:sugar-specific transcriptional regulator TrmB